METLDGQKIIFVPASDDGNLDGGWAIMEDSDYPTLCVYYEPKEQS
jgi:hypothetical protein